MKSPSYEVWSFNRRWYYCEWGTRFAPGSHVRFGPFPSARAAVRVIEALEKVTADEAKGS